MRIRRKALAPVRGWRLAVAIGAAVLAGLVPVPSVGAIVGGQATTATSYPYYVRVSVGAGCGGSVVDAEWILTAAHCVQATSGTVFICDQVPTPVREIVVHPLWNGSFSDGHDLALLRVDRSATVGDPTNSQLRVPLDCGPNSPNPFGRTHPVQVGAPFDAGAYAAGTDATMVGHGWTSGSSGPGTIELRDVHSILRSDDDMDDIYNPVLYWDGWNSDLMIGAGVGGHSVCEGDSGGPLTVTRNGRTVEVGVASFIDDELVTGNHCTQPGGFAELNGAQLVWIASRIPSVIPQWGPCTTPSWRPGEPYAAYGLSPLSAAHVEGQFGWELFCMPPTPTPQPDPPPADDPPTQCKRKPWLCE
jgi:hypothetical protein